MQSTRGRLLLFADADGATKFADLEKLEAELRKLMPLDEWENPAIVIGSRAHLEDNSNIFQVSSAPKCQWTDGQ